MSIMGPPKVKVLGTHWRPADDPVPWVTQRMVKSGAFAIRVTEDGRERMTGHAVSALLDILTETVSALHDDAKPYRVILSQAAATAGTQLNAKMVEIGSKPWRDKDLTDGQRAAVMAGLVLHEVGHIRFAQQYTRALNVRFGAGKVTHAIMALSNLAADCHDEHKVCALFPGLSDAIRPTLWWVGDKGMRSNDVSEVDTLLGRSIADRVNLAIAATRYPWQCDWSSADGQAWLAWWRAWGQRAQSYKRPTDHAAIVQEAIDYVRAFTPSSPTPPPPVNPPPPVGPPPPIGPKGPGGDDDDNPPPPPQRPLDDDEPPKGEGKGDPEDDDDSPPKGDDGPDEPEDEPGADGKDPTDPDDGEDGENGENEDEPQPPPDAPVNPGGDDKPEPPVTVRQGDVGHDDPDDTFDDREDGDMDDPCAVEKSKDARQDAVLQSEYEKAQRGTREGQRRRRYVHASSRCGSTVDWNGRPQVPEGRIVTSIPRKGGRWVR